MSHQLRNKPSLYLNSIELVPAVCSKKKVAFFIDATTANEPSWICPKAEPSGHFKDPTSPFIDGGWPKISRQQQKLGHWQRGSWAMWGLGIWHTKVASHCDFSSQVCMKDSNSCCALVWCSWLQPCCPAHGPETSVRDWCFRWRQGLSSLKRTLFHTARSH